MGAVQLKRAAFTELFHKGKEPLVAGHLCEILQIFKNLHLTSWWTELNRRRTKALLEFRQT